MVKKNKEIEQYLNSIVSLKRKMTGLKKDFIPNRHELWRDVYQATQFSAEKSANLYIGMFDLFIDVDKYFLTFTAGFLLAANSFPFLKANIDLLVEFLIYELIVLAVFLVGRIAITRSIIRHFEGLRKTQLDSTKELIEFVKETDEKLEKLSDLKSKLKKLDNF